MGEMMIYLIRSLCAHVLSLRFFAFEIFLCRMERSTSNATSAAAELAEQVKAAENNKLHIIFY